MCKIKKTQGTTLLIVAIVMAVAVVFTAVPTNTYASTVVTAPSTVKAISKNKSEITLTWKNDTNSINDGFMIYQKKGSGKYKKIATLEDGKSVTYTAKALKKNVKYSFKVKSYVKDNDGKYTYASGNTVTSVTKNSTKYRNVYRVKLSKKTMTLQYGKSKKLYKAFLPNKKLISRSVKWYVPATQKSVIKVSSTGKVTARHSGTAYVYVRAHNGRLAKCKVTVTNPNNKEESFTTKEVTGGLQIARKDKYSIITYTINGSAPTPSNQLITKDTTITLKSGDQLKVKGFISDGLNGGFKTVQTFEYTMK